MHLDGRTAVTLQQGRLKSCYGRLPIAFNLQLGRLQSYYLVAREAAELHERAQSSYIETAVLAELLSCRRGRASEELILCSKGGWHQ